MTTEQIIDGSLEMLENVFLEEKLQSTISFVSLFVLVFESFKSMVIDKPKSFYCLPGMQMKNGEFVYQETERYKEQVRKLAQKPLHASLKWFVQQGAIGKSDLERVIEIELKRNYFVHELFNVIFYGITDADKKLLTDLFSIYRKIDSWWIYNVEIDWDEIKDPDKIKMEDCHSCAVTTIGNIVEILLEGKGDFYKKYCTQIKEIMTKSGKNDAPNIHAIL